MCDLVLGDAVGNFWVEARGGADDCYEGICVEAVEDAACCNLEIGLDLVRDLEKV